MARAKEVMVVSSPRSKKRRHHKTGFTIPLAVVGGLAPLVSHGIKDFQDGGIHTFANGLSLRTTGWNIETNTWMPHYLKEGMLPIGIGVLVHKIIGGKLGVNRALGRAGIPFIRI